jgi:serine/threonine protein kinase
MLTEGYAPFEQYHRRGGQGPWTDIYGTAATLYLLITGQTPPPAPERIRYDELIPPLKLVPDLPQPLNDALLLGLAIDPEQRPQTMEQFEQSLHEMIEIRESPDVGPMECDTSISTQKKDKSEANLVLGVLFLLTAIIVIYQIFLISYNIGIGESLIKSWSFIFSILLATWVSIDAKINSFNKSLDFGFFFLIFWPIALPYYLSKTRGVKGFFQSLGFIMLYCITLLFSI